MHCANSARVVCLTGILLALTGCAGKIKYPSYYVLNLPAAPARLGVQSKPTLGSVCVRDFSAPSFLRAGPIVYRKSAEQIDFYQYHRWAVEPRRSATNALLRKIQAGGLFASVAQYDGRTSDYLITGTLDRLEEIDNGRDVRIAVGISAQLMDMKTTEVIWRDTSLEVARPEHRTVPGIVEGMSQATNISVDHLLSSMQKKLEAMSLSSMQRDVE
ncbi:MAG: membrane integrity-associated transporter subunit PqiC [Acidobacteriaceae bacterium]|nr:membrane integrity-associated transporter subunit PqiC [Acidobacteriaceae bacterium]